MSGQIKSFSTEKKPAFLVSRFYAAELEYKQGYDAEEEIAMKFSVEKCVFLPSLKGGEAEEKPTLQGIIDSIMPLATAKPFASSPAFFDFIQTDPGGSRSVGTCLVMRDVSLLEDISKLDQNADPATYGRFTCFIIMSQLHSFQVTRTLLNEFYRLLTTKGGFEAEKFAWWLVHDALIPPLGGFTTHVILPSNQSLFFPNYSAPPVPSGDVNVLPLFNCLGVRNVVKIISHILLDKNVVFYSESFALLPLIGDALLSLMYPFKWINPFVPHVPIIYKAILQSPGSSIYGLSTSDANIIFPTRETELGDVLYVDVDADAIYGNPDYQCLPNASNLVKDINRVLHSNLTSIKEGYLNPPKDDRSDYLISQEIRDQFINFFSDYLLKDYTSRYNGSEFDFESYKRSFISSQQGCISMFCESILFQEFVHEYSPTAKFEEIDYFAFKYLTRKWDFTAMHSLEYKYRYHQVSPTIKPSPSNSYFRMDVINYFKEQNQPNDRFNHLIEYLENEVKDLTSHDAAALTLNWMLGQLYILLKEKKWVDKYAQIVDKLAIARQEFLNFEDSFIKKWQAEFPSNLQAALSDPKNEAASKKNLTRLHSSDAPLEPKNSVALNLTKVEKSTKNPVEIVSDALDILIQIYRTHAEIVPEWPGEVFSDPHKLETIFGAASFNSFKHLISQLQYANLQDIPAADRLKFFLNLIQCFILHCFAEFKDFDVSKAHMISRICYRIGDHEYTHKELSNGIFRALANEEETAGPLKVQRTFSLISFLHFDGTRRFPFVKSYSGDNFRDEMMEQATIYCNKYFTVEEASNTICVPKAISSNIGKNLSERELIMYIFKELPNTKITEFLKKKGQETYTPLQTQIQVKLVEVERAKEFLVVLPSFSFDE